MHGIISRRYCAFNIFLLLNLVRLSLNSASLSMLPWPKPAVWPLVPPDASSEVLEKEKVLILLLLLTIESFKTYKCVFVYIREL